MKSQYPAAAKALLDWIARENLGPGTALPVGRILSGRLGFTQSIMLRACQLLVARGVVRREGYKLIVSSIQPREAELGVVYVLSYHADFSSETARLLAARGINFRLCPIPWTPHGFEIALRKTAAAKPAGLIVFRTPPWKRHEQDLLEKISVPVVFYTHTSTHPSSHSSAHIDSAGMAEMALRHLVELGHRRIACVSNRDELSGLMVKEFRGACFRLKLRAGACPVWEAPGVSAKAVQKTILEGHRRHPNVTALFSGDQVCIYATQVVDVPQELSVVGSGGIPEGLHASPPLTTVALADPSCVSRWVCNEMIYRLQAAASDRAQKPPSRALFVPDLVFRSSTRALARPETSLTEAHHVQDKINPGQTWKNVYPFLKNNSHGDWHQLDLTKLANHSMTRQHGWLGAEPLEHFPPGLRSIHGVPFQVIDERRNGGRAVVTFRSPRSHSSGKEKLPNTVTILVRCQAQALYFLHGCAWAEPIRFAEYVMHYTAGGSSRVTLIPLGHMDRKPRRYHGLRPNLQDWWSEAEQGNFPHAHRVTVFDAADPLNYRRTLYSLEWLNPHPDKEIECIKVHVNPKAGPALALIAVTALRNKSG